MLFRFCLVVSVTAFCSTQQQRSQKSTTRVNSVQNVDEMKKDLLEQCVACDMGRKVELRALVEDRVKALEALNPTPTPLESPELLTACWLLKYTTSESILGTSRWRPFRPRPRILQSIDAKDLKAKNEEWVLGGLLKNSVVAALEPRTDGKTVDVQFKRFGIGWLGIRAPKSARGFLETTYLDPDLRISRGDKGNIFILTNDGPPRQIVL